MQVFILDCIKPSFRRFCTDDKVDLHDATCAMTIHYFGYVHHENTVSHAHRRYRWHHPSITPRTSLRLQGKD